MKGCGKWYSECKTTCIINMHLYITYKEVSIGRKVKEVKETENKS